MIDKLEELLEDMQDILGVQPLIDYFPDSQWFFDDCDLEYMWDGDLYGGYSKRCVEKNGYSTFEMVDSQQGFTTTMVFKTANRVTCLEEIE